ANLRQQLEALIAGTGAHATRARAARRPRAGQEFQVQRGPGERDPDGAGGVRGLDRGRDGANARRSRLRAGRLDAAALAREVLPAPVRLGSCSAPAGRVVEAITATADLTGRVKSVSSYNFAENA